MYDMVISYGSDIIKTAYTALEHSCLSSLIKSDMKILIKPNLVLAKPASDGATTHPEVVRALIMFLKKNNCNNIIIAESAWAGGNTKNAFDVCGYTALSKEFNIPLIDLKDDKTVQAQIAEHKLDICKTALETDFLINVPVLKAHCQTNITCCLKNLKGVIPDNEKRRYHTLGLHRPIALLNKAVKTSFCLVDGICGDISFEEGGNPMERGTIIAGADPVTIDSYAANLLGYTACEVSYITYAADLGIGRLYDDNNTRVLELNKDKKPLNAPARSGIVNKLKAHIDENNACSACYAALVSALYKTGIRPAEKIKVGQGFKGIKGEGLGIGNCCSGFANHVKGCPPKASDTAKFLF